MIFIRTEPTYHDSVRGQQHLYFDTMTDYTNLPTLDKAAPGSDAYCIDTGQVFILNSLGVWKEQ